MTPETPEDLRRRVTRLELERAELVAWLRAEAEREKKLLKDPVFREAGIAAASRYRAISDVLFRLESPGKDGANG